MSGLRDLDERVLPRAAARLRAAVATARARRGALRTRVAGALVRPGPGLLERLDDRYAQRGPLAVLRQTPQIGLAVAGSVLLAGAGIAVARGGDSAADRGSSVAQGPPSLGPEIGDGVAAYIERSRRRAVALSDRAPQKVHVALVSLSAGLPPDATRTLLEGLEVQRAYLKVPSSAASEVLSADVVDLVGDLQALYVATAERKAEDREEFVKLSRSIPATNAEQQGFRDFYELSARLAGGEAEAYRTGCACVFAVVVRGTAATLATLPALTGVRAVEVAPAGVALEELRIRPLGPEQTTTVQAGAVPRPSRPGG